VRARGGGQGTPGSPPTPVGLPVGRYIITISGHGNGARGPHRGVVMFAIAAVITGRLMTAGKIQDVFLARLLIPMADMDPIYYPVLWAHTSLFPRMARQAEQFANSRAQQQSVTYRLVHST